MDSFLQALQSNGSLFPNFKLIYSYYLQFFRIIWTLSIIACVDGEAFVLISTRFSWNAV